MFEQTGTYTVVILVTPAPSVNEPACQRLLDSALVTSALVGAQPRWDGPAFKPGPATETG